MKKRHFVKALVGSMTLCTILSFCGCGSSNTQNSQTQSTNSTQTSSIDASITDEESVPKESTTKESKKEEIELIVSQYEEVASKAILFIRNGNKGLLQNPDISQEV